MREIEIEIVRRHIGALRQEAHVAQRAGVDDALEIAGLYVVQLARRGVRQIEKPREGIAQIEAAAAAVANVEYAAQFRVELLFVVEIGVLPVHRMADRRLQAAFRHDERRNFRD